MLERPKYFFTCGATKELSLGRIHLMTKQEESDLKDRRRLIICAFLNGTVYWSVTTNLAQTENCDQQEGHNDEDPHDGPRGEED